MPAGRKFFQLPVFIAGFFLLLHVAFSQQQQYYTAAVAEYSPIFALNPVTTKSEAQEIMFQNIQKFQTLIQDAKNQNPKLQIIVFPEYSLFGVYSTKARETMFPYLEEIPTIHDDEKKWNPCIDDSFNDRPILKALSCTAAKYQVYLVLGMGDVQSCSPEVDPQCPQDGRYQFNTQVAFSKNGDLIQKYHKRNLFYEPEFDSGDGEPKFFDTDFGVRFGMFICFDMIFRDPAIDLVEKYNIDNFVFSSWWVNRPPVINAMQTQQGWSRMMGVNLLASNVGNAWLGAGSSITSNGTVLAQAFNPDIKPVSKVIVAQVPLLPRGNLKRQSPKAAGGRDKMHLERKTTTSAVDTPSFNENYIPLIQNLTAVKIVPGNEYTVSLTAGTLTCYTRFKASQQQASSDDVYYAVAALKGQIFPLFTGDFCGIFKCGDKADLCQRVANYTNPLLSSSTSFDYIQISRRVQDADPANDYVYPLVTGSQSQLLQIQQDFTYYKQNAVHTLATMNGDKKQNKEVSESQTVVLSMMMMGRQF